MAIHLLTGAIQAAATVHGPLVRVHPLTGAVQGAAAAQAEFVLTMVGQISGKATVQAAWASAGLTGSVAGTTTLAGSLGYGQVSLAGQIVGRASVAGTESTTSSPTNPLGSAALGTSQVLSFRCDWSQPFEERRAFSTTIYEALDGNEQRRALRSIAKRDWQFVVTAIGPDETQILEALLFGDTGGDWLVPFWPHHTMLTSAATVGATTLACDTTDREFTVGQGVMVWRTPTQFAVAEVKTVASASVTITAGIEGLATWPTGTSVVPCRLGRIVDELDIERSFQTMRTRLNFRMRLGATAEAGTAGVTASAMTVGILPDGKNRRDAAFRNIDIYETPSTEYFSRRTERGRRFRFGYKAILDGLAEAKSLWTWYNARIGALNPCFVPAYLEDFTLTNAVAPADTAVTVGATGFAQHYLPVPRKQWLALAPIPGTVEIRQVTEVATAGAVETLTLASTAGVTIPAGTGVVCFARYCRLADDAVTLRWHRPGLAEVDLQFVEIADPLAYVTGGGTNPPVASAEFRAVGAGDSDGIAYGNFGTGAGGGPWRATGAGDSAGIGSMFLLYGPNGEQFIP